MSGDGEDALGFREDDAVRFIFGEDVAARMQDHDDDGRGGAFDRSLAELQLFRDVFSTPLKVAETSLLPGAHFAALHPPPQAGPAAKPPPPFHAHRIEPGRMHAIAGVGGVDAHSHSHAEQNRRVDLGHGHCHGMDGRVEYGVQEHTRYRSDQNGVDGLALELDSVLQGFLGYWPGAAPCATGGVAATCNQQQVFGAAAVENNVGTHMQAIAQDNVARACEAAGFGGSSSTSGVEDPMPSYIDALAEFSQFQTTGSLSDPFLYQWLNDQQPFPSDASCLTYDQRQMVDASQLLYTCSGAGLSERGAEQYPLFGKSAYDNAAPPCLSHDRIGSGAVCST